MSKLNSNETQLNEEKVFLTDERCKRILEQINKPNGIELLLSEMNDFYSDKNNLTDNNNND